MDPYVSASMNGDVDIMYGVSNLRGRIGVGAVSGEEDYGSSVITLSLKGGLEGGIGFENFSDARSFWRIGGFSTLGFSLYGGVGPSVSISVGTELAKDDDSDSEKLLATPYSKLDFGVSFFDGIVRFGAGPDFSSRGLGIMFGFEIDFGKLVSDLSWLE